MGAISCIAFVGKSNNPLYIKNLSTAEDLKFHYIVNTSLDVIDEKGFSLPVPAPVPAPPCRLTSSFPPCLLAVTSAIKGSEMYLGLLYTMEDIRV